MIRTVPLFLLAAALCAQNLPQADLHVHLDAEEKGVAPIKPAEAAEMSRKLGVRFGVLAEGGCGGDIRNDATLAAFVKSVEGLPLYRGLQVYGFQWRQCLSKENLAKLDYISADALVFPDTNGKSVWLWLPDVRFDDAQDFMDRYVAFNVKVLSQPIQVWTNPTYLPESLQSRYNELWTVARMRQVIDAAVKNKVAIELNTKYRIPSAAFIRLAKAAGVKFTFGSNGHARGIGDISYGMAVARECGLTGNDFWAPPERAKSPVSSVAGR